MKTDSLSLRIGAGVVAAAIVLRLLGSGALQPIFGALLSPKTANVLLFLETGRLVRQPVTAEAESPPEVLPPPTPAVEPAVFSRQDADLVQVNSYCNYEADPEILLQMPLNWDLTEDGPKVLILGEMDSLIIPTHPQANKDTG